MKNVLDILKERGFIKQTVFEDELYKLLDEEKITFYVGFDPTADSLHIGHYIPIMAMAHLQRAGHRPIALIGGGTALVGDPTGRTDMRSMLTREVIAANCAAFKKQMSRFINFEGENAAILENNADWLTSLNYIDFLREVGTHFSVNKMLTAECFKTRMEKGLSFLEFNYMLMQAYDYLVLYRKYGCKLEVGGNDQWSNILAGADLVRRKEEKTVFAATFALLENSDGKKMGKTAKGALWLDKNKTSPYEFYQFFRNVEDAKVEECLKLLTFIDLEEIAELTKFKDERINEAKKRLAYEVTKLVHGEDEANRARDQAEAAFGGENDDKMPSVTVDVTAETLIADLMFDIGIVASKSEARRLIDGGGVRINDAKVVSASDKLNDYVTGKEFVLHKGKKIHLKVFLR